MAIRYVKICKSLSRVPHIYQLSIRTERIRYFVKYQFCNEWTLSAQNQIVKDYFEYYLSQRDDDWYQPIAVISKEKLGFNREIFQRSFLRSSHNQTPHTICQYIRQRPFLHPSNPLLIKCSRIYQYRSGIHRMSHNGHCVIRTMQKNYYDWFHWNGDGWCHLAHKKGLQGQLWTFMPGDPGTA